MASMPLRKKTLLGLLAGLMVAAAALTLLFEMRVTASFRKMENALAHDRLRLVDNLYAGALRQLDSFAKGFSEWDDALRVVEERDDPGIVRDFVAGSFDPAALRLNDVGFAVILDEDRQPVFAVGQSPDGGEPAYMKELLAILAVPGPLMPERRDLEQNGLLMLDGAPYLVVSQPVQAHTPTLRRATRGRFVMGRALRGAVLEGIIETTDYDLGVLIAGHAPDPVWADAVPADIRGNVVEACAGAPDHRLVRLLPDGSPVGGVGLRDLATGRPAAALWARLPASGVGTAGAVRGFFLTSLALLGLGMALAFYLQVEISLLRPLAAIQNSLSAINATGDRSLRAPRVGGAEFMAHADRINDTLAGLQNAEAVLERRLRIEEALAEAARLLVRGGPDVLAACLRALGEKLDVDVVSYYALENAENAAGAADDGESTMRCAGTFRDPTTRLFAGTYSFEAPAADWIVKASRTGRPIVITDTTNIPADMEGVREFIGEYGLKSFLGMPMTGGHDGRPGRGGVVGLGNVGRTHCWSDEDLRAIATIAELLDFGLPPDAK